MDVIQHILEIRNKISDLKAKNFRIGFVPTMGALHEGHLSLVRKAKEECNIVVVSIFVNPIQFNKPEDLKNYPRTIDNDLLMLEKENCDLVFTPSEAEMYPKTETLSFDFGALDKVMEGAFRPGHFIGVAIVVKKLFEIIQQDKAYFGEKDFQQLQIIKELVRQLNIPVEIIGCPIIREKDGLAMSSRNALLDPKMRILAPEIYKSLQNAALMERSCTPQILKEIVINEINATGLRVEYFEISNPQTLLPISDWKAITDAIGCIAVQAGKVRLIDNIKL
ncbi:MAG: pantoate--beta-alanine ligase [Bacteroidetes bacterium RIFOXYA12_FULL_35_11]|nr:MAG: pantoate--beta-alanine ligase [Bacteroidetes bacterium GWF2_35_48]OFY75885.1 MAG: pantoate--beta-alanine ligase [Bacteroidetes bacterium RIFOXYA12_FULL_35_11]HBX52147.1 pantoate--beta-alanine ligase [Bacteroidales bacterium]